MAKSRVLTVITEEAKHLKKKYPHRYDHLKKSERWSSGYIKQASAIYASKHHGKSPVGKKRKLKTGVRKRKISARRPVKGKKLVRYVEKTSTERVMTGRHKKKCHCTHRVYMAGTGRRYRQSVSGTGGNTGLLIGLGIGAVALYLIATRSKQQATTAAVPAIQQTSNVTRNTQSADIVNYALAAGLTAQAITSLINNLNNSSDTQVSNIYDNVSAGGDVGVYV